MKGFQCLKTLVNYNQELAHTVTEHTYLSRLLPFTIVIIHVSGCAGGTNDVRTLFDVDSDAEACEHVGDDMHESHFGERGERMATADGDVRVRCALLLAAYQVGTQATKCSVDGVMSLICPALQPLHQPNPVQNAF